MRGAGGAIIAPARLPKCIRPASLGWDVALGQESGVPMIELGELTTGLVRSGWGNPDGMYWDWEGHPAFGPASVVALPYVDTTVSPTADRRSGGRVRG